MKTVDILIAARDRISNIQNWCRGTLMNDAGTRFCAIGSVGETVRRERLGTEAEERALEYLQAAARQLGAFDVVNINDACGRPREAHDKVLVMYNLAIKNAKRRHKNGKRYAGPVAPVAPVFTESF